jgi:hypothetical protein
VRDKKIDNKDCHATVTYDKRLQKRHHTVHKYIFNFLFFLNVILYFFFILSFIFQEMRISNRKNFKLTIKRISWLSLISFQILSYGSYTILVHLSEENGRINFNSTSLNFLIELLKLTVSLICHGISCFFKRNSLDKKNSAQKYDSFIDEESQIKNSNKVSLLKSLYFAFPAVLYCINNNLGNKIFQFYKNKF